MISGYWDPGGERDWPAFSLALLPDSPPDPSLSCTLPETNVPANHVSEKQGAETKLRTSSEMSLSGSVLSKSCPICSLPPPLSPNSAQEPYLGKLPRVTQLVFLYLTWSFPPC